MLLSAVLAYNAPAAPHKYDRLRQVIGLDAGADLSAWVAGLSRELGLPAGLAAMDVSDGVAADIAEYAEHDPATETNPRPAPRADYEAMLRASWGG